MEIMNFGFSPLPRILFGRGNLDKLPGLLGGFGKNVLLVTGSDSFDKSGKQQLLLKNLDDAGIRYDIIRVSGEPSPEFIDDAVKTYAKANIEAVAAIGGGSVMDAGKALSAMLTKSDSIMNYLEGVGNKQHDGAKLPFIAVPTTAGTGSEATKNAVISRSGSNGFKKSLRHENFIPDVALIDPELHLSCPAEITASTGLDAITQLLESFVSIRANELTDALAWSGLQHAFSSFERSCRAGSNDIEARSGMAYASLISGICLANAGLGIVHGFASVIGGYYNIPHGVVCGTLFAEATKANIAALQEIDPETTALQKYARAGFLAAGKKGPDIFEGWTLLLDKLDFYTGEFNIPRLGEYGIRQKDLDKIVSESGQKNNPVSLSEERMKHILLSRL